MLFGEMADNGFPYGIGAEYNGTEVAEDGFDIVEIPAHTYAVFVCRGRMPDAFREIYRRICTEFFPQNTAYEYGAAWSLRSILRRTFKIPIIPARYGSPSKKRRTDEKGLPDAGSPDIFVIFTLLRFSPAFAFF